METGKTQRRVLIVEDNKPFLDFICSMLRQYPDFQIVGEARDGCDAVAQAEALRPDLLLLDIGLPGLNGIEVARRVRQFAPDVKIVFLTQESSADMVQEAFRVSALAYVLKASAARDLPLALEAVWEGKKFASRGVDKSHLSRSDVA